MPRQIRPAKNVTSEPAYRVWKAAAAAELEQRHGIAATAIPERVCGPNEAAARAEFYDRSIRPAGAVWRKTNT